MSAAPFAGSYRPGDVEFLLRPIQLPTTPLEERERQIQSRQSHYSEMIGPEDAPSRERVRLFRQCLAANGDRFAVDLARLARAIAKSVSFGELTLVSIARAGTPVGVILLHWLRRIAPAMEVRHYSISVIRDRGADLAAIGHILARHAPASVRFIDGWTGKGTIARELNASIAAWTGAPCDLDPGLWVPLDVCGHATYAATGSDYLIPPALLGGTISGLVSRSVLPKDGERVAGDFHQCVPLDHLRSHDLSGWFVDYMVGRIESVDAGTCPESNTIDRTARMTAANRCLEGVMERYGIRDPNRVKLGIGETVRVLLRRLPKVVILHPEIRSDDGKLVSRLASIRGVPVILGASLEFRSVAVIDQPPDEVGFKSTDEDSKRDEI